MREFDNIKIVDLTELLNEYTTLSRFYSLIPLREMLIENMLECGIEDKYMFLEETKVSFQELSKKTDIEIDVLKKLEQFLHLHDFINRRLTEVKSVNQNSIKALTEQGVKYSKEYIQLCQEHGFNLISDRYGIAKADAERLFCQCDLMRLPGVKDVRSSLYYDCGYRSLQVFQEQNAKDM